METLQIIQKSIVFMRNKITEVRQDPTLPENVKSEKLACLQQTLQDTTIVYSNLYDAHLEGVDNRINYEDCYGH